MKKEDYDKMSYEQKKALSSQEKDEMLRVYEEWFEEQKNNKSDFEIKLENFLEEISDIDTFLENRQDDVNILFMTQWKYLKKSEFVNHLKEELLYYAKYFDVLLSDEEFESMYNKVSEIEEKYSRLVTFDI